MAYDVFISYARKDYVDAEKNVIPDNIILKIKQKLSSDNISFWFDEEGIYTGDAFAPVIAKNIKEAKIFLFVSSVNSNASEWTAGEVATAHMYGKKIVPVKVDDSNYNDSIILHLAHLDYVDYRINPEKALSRLMDSIKGYLDEIRKSEERALKEAEEKRRIEGLKEEKAKALSQLREKMAIVRTERENLFAKLQALESEAAQLRIELEMVDSGYKELQYKESALLDNDFEYRLRTLTEKKIEQKPVPNKGKKQRSERNKKMFGILSIILIIVLAVVTLTFLYRYNKPISNNGAAISNQYIKNAISYLDNNAIWSRSEMEAIPGLLGVWDRLNEYDMYYISRDSFLNKSIKYRELNKLAREIIKKKGTFVGTYCPDGDECLTYPTYRSVLLSKSITSGSQLVTEHPTYQQ